MKYDGIVIGGGKYIMFEDLKASIKLKSLMML